MASLPYTGEEKGFNWGLEVKEMVVRERKRNC